MTDRDETHAVRDLTVGKSMYTGRVERNRMRVSATVDGHVIEWTATALPTLQR